MKKSKHIFSKKWYLAAGVAATLAAAVSCSKKENPIHPEYKPLVEAVYASGNIVPKDEYKIFSEVDGHLLKRLVNEGDSVHVGQPLFVIERDQQDIKLQSTKELYETALSNYSDNSPALQELKHNLDNARNKLHNDSVNYIRYKNLIDHQATSQAEYDRAQLSYKNSQNDYASARERYASTKTQLKNEYINAKMQYELNNNDLGNYTITSNINGRIYDVYKQEGELVKRQEAIAMTGESGHVYLKLTVDELDIEKLKLGQEVLVTADVYKDKVFHAKVSKIYPMLNAQDQSFRVDAEFTGDAPKGYSGLTVEANIVIQKKEHALTIPKAYVIGQDSVLVKDGKETKKVKIGIGAQTYETVEITGGVDASATIVKKQ